MSVYGQIAKYPVAFPGIKNACIKWSWRQTPRLGWCPIPVDISHRFSDESKYEWCELMAWIEEVFGSMYAMAENVITNYSAVAESDKLKRITCWVSSVEVDVMTLIFQSPKQIAATAHEKQKVTVFDKIASIVAMQVLELVKGGAPAVARQIIPSLEGGEKNKLLQKIMELVRNDAWPIIEPAAVDKEITVLAPVVTTMDAQGRATTELATVSKKRALPVDVLPWAKWVELETPCRDNKLAKLILETVIRRLHRFFMADPPPNSMVRIGKRIEMRTKESIPTGKCVIPIFFRKLHSMVMEGEQEGARPRNGVYCRVEWTRRPVGFAEVAKYGEREDDVSVKVFIMPEVKVPKGNPDEALEWTMSEELHPFWFVKRGGAEDTTNMKLVYLSTSQILACDTTQLRHRGNPVNSITDGVEIGYPCLVNTVDLGIDEELVLEWSQAVVKPPPKSAKGKNAYDQLADAAANAKRARQKEERPEA